MDADTLTYAIGDIHGCADQLDDLLDRIEAHRADRPRKLVFIGDYIDRGPQSRRVVETLTRLQYREPEDVVCLMGNHEAMLLAALNGGQGAENWLYNGGGETLESYNAQTLADIPREHLDWFEGLPSVHGDDLRWYVHAGFRPEVAAPDPDIETRLWIRDPFLGTEHDFGRHVVHGHTPQTNGKPEALRFRTNLDTGAVFGGPLTAGIFTARKPGPAEFLTAPAR